MSPIAWFLLVAMGLQPPVPPRPVAAIDVAGMEPQLRLVRRAAEQHRWRITCVGRSGEATVLRLVPDNQESAIILNRVFSGGDVRVSAAHYYYPSDSVPASCDLDPSHVVNPGFASTLAIGPRNLLSPLLELARECGFTRTHVRERRPNDLPVPVPNDAHGWHTLDAGENVMTRNEPMLCFTQLMSNHAETPR